MATSARFTERYVRAMGGWVKITHTPEYQPQPGEVIAVRDDYSNTDWLIREFIRHTGGGLLVEIGQLVLVLERRE